MNGKHLTQTISVIAIMLILIVSSLGTYSAAREIRSLRTAFSEFTLDILTHHPAKLEEKAFRKLEILIRNEFFYRELTTLATPIDGLDETEASRIIENFLQNNIPPAGEAAPAIIRHLDLVMLDYTERELRLMELLQLSLSFSSIGFAVVIIGLLLHNRNQESLTRTLKSLNRQHNEEIEELKARVSSEIHDKIIQDLALLKIGMESGSSGPNEVKRGISSSIADLRRVIGGFQPWDTQRIGLVFSIEMLAKSYSKGGGIRVLTALPLEEEIKLSQRARVHILRIIQELISNALKHADASLVQITMKCEENILNISLLDNGRGFDTSTMRSRDSFGMVTINERIKNLGGTSRQISRKGSGSRIVISIPMESDDE